MRNPLSIAASLALFTLPPALACSSSAEFSESSRVDIRPRPENPIELGRVHWKRDLDAALAEARAAKKPVFALFQEIPGCATCQRFGAGPLSNPLLVEAIEELFVPVATYNNRQGDDAQFEFLSFVTI